MKRIPNKASHSAKRNRSDDQGGNRSSLPRPLAAPNVHEGRRQQARLIELAMQDLRRPTSGLQEIHITGFALLGRPPTEVVLKDEKKNVWGMVCCTSTDQAKSAQDCMHFADALARNTSLRQLSIATSPRECLPILMALISHSGLRSLEWSEIPEGETSEDAQSVEFPLNLGLVPEAVFAISEILRSNRLNRLSLTGLLFGREDFLRLAQGLEANSSLQEFTMDHMIAGEDCKILSEALASRKNIRALALRDCMVIGENLTRVLQLLRRNPDIVDLDVSGNLMIADQLSDLIERISVHGAMRRLAFSMCFPREEALPDDLVHSLIAALKVNPVLVSLDFGSLLLSMAGGEAVRQFFETSRLWAPLSQIHFHEAGRLEARTQLTQRLDFLDRILDQLEHIQEIAKDVLTLYVQKTMPGYSPDVLKYLIDQFAILPKGKDALVSLAGVVGFQLDDAGSRSSQPESGPEIAAPAEPCRQPISPPGLLRRRRARKHRNPRPAQN